MLPKDLPGQVKHVLPSSTMRDVLVTMAERIERLERYCQPDVVRTVEDAKPRTVMMTDEIVEDYKACQPIRDAFDAEIDKELKKVLKPEVLRQTKAVKK